MSLNVSNQLFLKSKGNKLSGSWNFLLKEHANTHSLDLKTYYVSKVSRNFPSNINPRSRGTDDNSETENALEIDTSTSSSPSKTVDGRPIPYSAVSGEQVPVSVGEDCSIVPSQLELFDIPNLESDCFFLPALQPSETRFKDFNQCIFYCKICESKVKLFLKTSTIKLLSFQTWKFVITLFVYIYSFHHSRLSKIT